jgi:hypothetical protein
MQKHQILLTDERYEGKYVALRSILDRTVIASGDNPKSVLEQAKKQGAANPVVLFVPQKDITLVYADAY